MQTTTNIGLKTYEANDPTDWLGEFNYNMNKIDTAVGTQNQTITVIGADVTTAVNTANTANSTASEALQTANTKASINDSVASATTTYSGNKINDLISGIQPGTEIDDTVTSTTKTWSSSKINTEITALTQEHFNAIENPDTSKYGSWTSYYVYKGKILEIYGQFSFIDPPSQQGTVILNLPENIEVDIPNGSFYVNGLITKNGDNTYFKNDVIFQFNRYNQIGVFFPDDFNYSQLTANHVLHYSITLIKGN